jgi:hypothetical protein
MSVSIHGLGLIQSAFISKVSFFLKKDRGAPGPAFIGSLLRGLVREGWIPRRGLSTPMCLVTGPLLSQRYLELEFIYLAVDNLCAR